MSSADSVSVKVVARFRPRTRLTETETPAQILKGKSVQITTKFDKVNTQPIYHLDLVFNRETSQEEFFNLVGRNTVQDALNGYNGTLFAYGQTGSGKTHTLFGDMLTQDSKERGIIPRACEMLFNSLEEDRDVEEALIKGSFIEIYQENIQDLLQPSNKLRIREAPDKSIFIQGVCEEYVASFQDVYNLIQIGFRNRAVASTRMNAASSRSHCVLRLSIRQTLLDGSVKNSKLNFADLAGSERVEKTGATGQTLEEAKAINQSLSALGNCINALTASGRAHIPFRDSKLTYLLKDSLGGNTKTTLITTLSSDNWNLEETISTLRFATRAKQIKNAVHINRILGVKELEYMVSVYKKKLKGANSSITRLTELVRTMRSSKFNPERHGPKIDKYIHQLVKERVSLTSPNDGNTSTPDIMAQPTTPDMDNQPLSPILSPVKSPIDATKEKANMEVDHSTVMGEDISTFKFSFKARRQSRIRLPKVSLNKTIDDRSNGIIDDRSDVLSKTAPVKLKVSLPSSVSSSISHSPNSSAPSESVDASIDGGTVEIQEIMVMNSLRTSLAHKEDEVKSLQQELSELRSELFQKHQEIVDQEKEIHVMRESMVTNSQQHCIGENESESQAEGVISSPEHDIELLQAKVEELQMQVNSQCSEIEKLSTNNEQIDKDRKRLLEWNGELQLSIEKSKQSMTGQQKNKTIWNFTENHTKLNELNVERLDTTPEISEVRQQLTLLKPILDDEINSKQSIFEDNSCDISLVTTPQQSTLQSAATEDDISEKRRPSLEIHIQHWKSRVSEAYELIQNLDKRLTNTPADMEEQDLQELIFASLSTITALLTQSQNPLRNAQFAKLQRENKVLIHKLTQMKQTWVAHLEMFMSESGSQTNRIPPDSPSIANRIAFATANDIRLGSKSKSTHVTPIASQKPKISKFRKFKKSKFAKPVSKRNRSHPFGSMISALSSAINHYFGQSAILKGNLEMCIVPISFLDFAYVSTEWRKYWFVLTKTQLFGFESKLHSETSEIPIFECALNDVISVLRLEEVITEKSDHNSDSNVCNLGIFILANANKKWLLKSSGNLSRELWIENIEKIISSTYRTTDV